MKIAFGVTCDMKIELQGSSVKSQVGLVKSQVGSQVGSFVKSQVGLTSPSINSVNSVSSNSLASLSGDEVLNVVNDVLGYLLKVKPVIICIHNVHFMDQSSAEAISRLMTLQCKSLFVFAASPSSEQFNYPLFQSTPHLIKQQPTLKYPDELQKFSSRCYLQWFSSLRDKLLKGNGAAKFIFIDRLDNEDMQDKIKGAIIVSRLNDRIANNDKEYESVLDIPKVLTMILHFTGKASRYCWPYSTRLLLVCLLACRCEHVLVTDVPGTRQGSGSEAVLPPRRHRTEDRLHEGGGHVQ